MRLFLITALLGLTAVAAHAFDVTLARTNIVVPAGRTFQFPLTAFDANHKPVTFAVTSSQPGAVTTALAPASNRSLQLTVSGVDAGHNYFTEVLTLQLFEDLMPRTTARIIALTNAKFYNGKTFHRIIQDFMCQGGDPLGNGSGGTGVKFDDEFSPGLTFTGFGQLSMANSGDDSNDSQFFITDQDLSLADPNRQPPRWLDFNYNLFGQMTRGFDTLAKMIGTPVTNEHPQEPVTIESAKIITDTQAAVLRIAAASNFTGTATLTISATNPGHGTINKTVLVNVIANTVNAPAFLGPIPRGLAAASGQTASFLLKTTDLEGDNITLALVDTNTFQFPPQLSASYISNDYLYLAATTSFAGTLNLIMACSDGKHNNDFDTQHFSLTVRPVTMSLTPKAGTFKDVAKPLGDSVKISGNFTFGVASHTFGTTDTITLWIGTPSYPIMLTYGPGVAGYTSVNGVVKIKSPRGVTPAITAEFNSVRKTFKIQLTNFDFPVTLTNPMSVSVQIGTDFANYIRGWNLKSTGYYVLPTFP